MKNVLLILGSPRKKNTLKLAELVMENMKSYGNFNFQYIFLSEINLQTCKGCMLCIKNGDDKCPINDGLKMLYEKMEQADGVIFASPVYVMQITAIMKNFIDRFAFMCHRPRFFRKQAFVITTTGQVGAKPVLKYLSGVAEIWGFQNILKFSLSTPPFDKEFSPTDKEKQKIKNLSKKFAENINLGKVNPSFGQVIMFEIQKKMFLQPKIAEVMKADYSFFSKEKDHHFHQNIKPNILYSVLAKLLSGITFLMMKD